MEGTYGGLRRTHSAPARRLEITHDQRVAQRTSPAIFDQLIAEAETLREDAAFVIDLENIIRVARVRLLVKEGEHGEAVVPEIMEARPPLGEEISVPAPQVGTAAAAAVPTPSMPVPGGVEARWSGDTAHPLLIIDGEMIIGGAIEFQLSEKAVKENMFVVNIKKKKQSFYARKLKP